MNAQEFGEMQGEFAAVVYSYERMQKEAQMIDIQYNYYFSDLLDQVNYYSEELKCMQQELKMLSENSDMEAIEKFREEFKKNHEENLKKIAAKHNYSKVMVERFLNANKEELNELEEVYKEYILKYHPAVKLFVSKGEVELYNHLKRYYVENNLKSFKDLLALNEPNIKFKELTDEDKIKFSENYYNARLGINQEAQKMSKEYPYIKKDVFVDDISRAQEEGEIKVNVTKLRDAHKKLSVDYVNAFGKEFTF